MQEPPFRVHHFPLRALSSFFNFLEPFSLACSWVLFHTHNAPGILAFQSLYSILIRLCHISITPAEPFMGFTSLTKRSFFRRIIIGSDSPIVPLTLTGGLHGFPLKD